MDITLQKSPPIGPINARSTTISRYRWGVERKRALLQREQM
jgi:hypothetical protein